MESSPRKQRLAEGPLTSKDIKYFSNSDTINSIILPDQNDAKNNNARENYYGKNGSKHQTNSS